MRLFFCRPSATHVGVRGMGREQIRLAAGGLPDAYNDVLAGEMSLKAKAASPASNRFSVRASTAG